MTNDDHPRLELSLTQIIASALAAMTAAVLASFLGVAGTVIGAAVFSVIGTAGSAIYSHSIRRTKARLRRTLIIPVHPGSPPAHAPTGVAAQDAGVFDGSAGAAGAARAAWAAAAAARAQSQQPSPAEAAAEGAPGDAAVEPGTAEPDNAEGAAVPPGESTEPFAAGADAAGVTASGVTAAEAGDQEIVEERRVVGEPTGVGGATDARSAVVEETEQSTRRPLHWKAVAMAAAAVFVVAMAGITVVEAIAGESVPSLVHGNKHGSRFWFEPARKTTATPTPTTSGTPSPTATPTASPTVQPSPSLSVSPSPTAPTPSSPAPTPTESAPGSPSPSPTGSPSPAPSGSPSGPPPAGALPSQPAS